LMRNPAPWLRRGFVLVPRERLELSRYRYRRILSPLRLPFRHPGTGEGSCKYKDFPPPGKPDRAVWFAWNHADRIDHAGAAPVR
jgi:hypothetical protein